MATKLTTTNYKALNGKLLIDDVSNTHNTYYLFVGDHDLHSNAALQPIFENTYDTYTYPYQQMIFGKKIQSTNIYPVIRNIPYTTSTIYDHYDDKNEDLNDEEFFAITLEGSYRHVWKCLDNNNDGNSTITPLFSDIVGSNTNLYQTSDGYRWKYMTSILNSIYTRYSTADYFPVIANTSVTNMAVPGAIDIVLVEHQGRGYHNYINGTFAATDIRMFGNPFFYNISNTTVISTNGYYTACILYITTGAGAGQYSIVNNFVSNSSGNIVELTNSFPIAPVNGDSYQIRPQVVITSSDGQQTINCVARALVNALNSNSIHRCEVLQRGAGYHDSNAVVVANGIIGVTNTAIVRPINPPPGGHGSNILTELYSNAVVINAQLSNTEVGTVPSVNRFQQYGIIKNCLFNNVAITVAGGTGLFTSGETLLRIRPKQCVINATANVSNNFISSNTAAFTNQFVANDYVFITSADGISTQIAVVSANTSNSTHLVLTTSSRFSCTQSKVYFPNVDANTTILSVSNLTNIIVNNALGIWNSGDYIVGLTTGSTATITNIARNGDTKTFNTFVQMYKYIATVTTGTFVLNETVKSASNSSITAQLHSTTGTTSITAYLTNFTGGRTFAVGEQFFGVTSGAIAAVTTRYEQELIFNSGEILYVENIDPVTRSPTQQESFNVIFNF